MATRKNTLQIKKRKSATVFLDGCSYTIVFLPGFESNKRLSDRIFFYNKMANPSEAQETRDAYSSAQKPVSTKSDSVVVRQVHPREGALICGVAHDKDNVMERLDTKLETLPGVEATGACDKAASRLREILYHLQHGEVPMNVIQKSLQYAASVLETVTTSESKQLVDEDDLSEVQPDAVPDEVRDWLATTFTRHATAQRRRGDDKPRFRSVANAIRAGIIVDKIYRRIATPAVMQIPKNITKHLKNMDNWSFDVFSVNHIANGQILRYLTTDLLNRYGLISKFKIPVTVLESFLIHVELGYGKYKNPYHNDVHAADVTQTVHYMLCQAGLVNWLTDVEVFATLFAAVIHDYEHTGTTNNFHVMFGSEMALLYNDRAVLENHHLSASFRLLKDENLNVLQNLSKEEYRGFPGLVVEMVLGTDMSSHFHHLKTIKTLISHPELNIDKAKAMALVLHCCDISHPSKEWRLHFPWTQLLMEEFFQQGDKEKELGLPFSPLCDRNTTLVAESQIGFINFIVSPSMELLGDLLDKIQFTLTQASGPAEDSKSEDNGSKSEFNSSIKSAKDVNYTSLNTANGPGFENKAKPSSNSASSFSSSLGNGKKIQRPWVLCLEQNKAFWQERSKKDAEIKELEDGQRSSLKDNEEERSHLSFTSSEKQ
ncbi:dual specificity calcium/calmodulin-dependent 3',5'-cyclic nucleotide phosphodiesterase 1A-like [Tachypleus tridentatus]|uniref:dual specificity calcium/calmodulin-dependent 3',5'-cyclic nucleotide phosphodiesterase 1A-like n=1 Tax=Tachypleus tridentatus TaxID=6853 RepID=UPI003FD4BAD6